MRYTNRLLLTYLLLLTSLSSTYIAMLASPGKSYIANGALRWFKVIHVYRNWHQSKAHYYATSY